MRFVCKCCVQVRTAWRLSWLCVCADLVTPCPGRADLLTCAHRYRPAVDVSYVCRTLACSADQFETLTEPAALVFTDATRGQLDCKASMACLAAL